MTEHEHEFVPRNEYREDRREHRLDIEALKADFRLALHEALLPILTQLNQGREEIRGMKDQIRTQNGRVSKLENWRWSLVGAGAVAMWVVDRFFTP